MDEGRASVSLNKPDVSSRAVGALKGNAVLVPLRPRALQRVRSSLRSSLACSGDRCLV